MAKIVVTGTTEKPGPNLVYGADAIQGPDGEKPTDPAKLVALCACGRSKTKPYCDGSHQKAGG